MNKNELWDYLVKRNLINTKKYKKENNYSVFANRLNYVQNCKGEGVQVFHFNQYDNICSLLLPKKNLTVGEIGWLTTNRKHNLWADSYTNHYGEWFTFPVRSVNEEQLDALFDTQHRQYEIFNSLHKAKDMTDILNQMNNLKEEIKTKKKSLETLNKKIIDVVTRKLSIEDEDLMIEGGEVNSGRRYFFF